MLARPRYVIAPLALLLALALAACSEKKSPEELIKKTLDDATAALAEKRIGDAGDALSDDYIDKSGRDKRKMKGLALFATRQGNITLKRTDETITVDGETALVSTKVWAVQTAADAKVVGDLVPQGNAVEVKIKMKKEGDDWKVVAIEGDRYGGG